jgi:hypothetical protein
MRGRTLLAHELAHVVQQRAGTRAQRDKVPVEFQKSMDVAGMSDADLHARYDAIVQVLATFTTSGPETALLEQELGRIGAELVQRAIGAGRTFGKPAVEAARKYFMDNAKKSKPDSCIIALNKGLKLFTAKTDLPTTPKTIERSMEKVVAAGFATGPREIQFTARGGKITHGGARPHALAESVWDALIAMTGGDFGVSVFTMSLMDGDHSVTLTLDRTDPGQPHVYWSDQWSSKGGWKEYDRAGLDAEVTRLIQGWWDDQPEGKKFNTVIRLWRMRSQSATAAAPVAPSP